MVVEVIINGIVIRREEVDGINAMSVASWFYNSYHVEELSQCKVDAAVYISEVQSKLNDENFIARPEVFDELHFSETAL